MMTNAMYAAAHTKTFTHHPDNLESMWQCWCLIEALYRTHAG